MMAFPGGLYVEYMADRMDYSTRHGQRGFAFMRDSMLVYQGLYK